MPLSAGGEVDLALRHEPLPARGFGHAAVSLISFQLLVAADTDYQAELAEAVALASEADVAVVVLGTTEDVENAGFDRASLALPGRQDELVRRIGQANPRTVVVVNAGAPVLLPWAEDVPAVLLACFPRQEFGNALADVLSGSPSRAAASRSAGPRPSRDSHSTMLAAGTRLRRGPVHRLPLVRPLRAEAAVSLRARAGLHNLGVPLGRLSPGAGAAAAVAVTVRLRNTAPAAGARLSRSTPADRTARSNAQRAGSPGSPPPLPAEARR